MERAESDQRDKWFQAGREAGLSHSSDPTASQGFYPDLKLIEQNSD